MAVLPILKFPDPLLQQKSASVESITPDMSSLIDDLLDTMRASPGGVGISAPQVGILKRIVTVDVSASKRGSQASNNGLLVLINPEILAKGGRQIVREGCMSIPDYTANIERAQWVLVDALDRDGKQVILESVGFEAVAIQHEVDHLDGILFLDRVTSIKTDLFRRKKYR
ncbi:MAG TPA: peptide deformylase [Candidatus Deferrimicrobiaceae bacterium]|jgi:peptide deformylase